MFCSCKWPSKFQWLQFFKVLGKKEKIAFSAFAFLAFFSFFTLVYGFYLRNTRAVPAYGGVHIEGLIGQPRFINPIYAPLNDIDRDLTRLIFSGLMKYDLQGNLVPDLADCEIKEQGRVYECVLREDIFWHDGQELTLDDVIFTLETIQNPIYRSPLWPKWLGVEIEKISEQTIRFTLPTPSAPFLENLTLKILPRHIWRDISPEAFPLAIYNLRPVGSGPYKFREIKKDELGRIESLSLSANPQYFQGQPFISEIDFLFFRNEQELVKAAQQGQITGFSLSPLNPAKAFERNWQINFLVLPRYFAIFFNPQEAKVFQDINVRQALSYAVNQQEIIAHLLYEQGQKVSSPILPGILNFSAPQKIYEPNLEKAKELLEKAGFDKENPLKFSLSTVDQPLLRETAELLKRQWQAVDVEVEINIYALDELEREVIRTRNFQSLLFGQVLSAIPDPFVFWHSLQKRDPGLNLAIFENNRADFLLERARQTLNQTARAEKLEEFQNIVIEQAPAVFLYNPYYLYLVSRTIKKPEMKLIITPTERFANIEEWYIRTRRIWR